MNLIEAAYCGNIDVVRVLISQGADVNQGTGYGVKSLIVDGDNIIQTIDYGVTALELAAQNGHDKVVELLLDNGAYVDQATKKGQTALMAAAHKGRDKVVELLLQRKAKINAMNYVGETPLIIAAWRGHDKVVKLLLEHGADVNHLRSQEVTALMVAAKGGHDKVVKLLLENKADVNKVMLYGRTALMFAVQDGHEKVVELLLEHGADADRANSNGKIPLMYAAEKGNDKIVKLLLNKGVDPNKDEVQTAFRLAFFKYHNHVVKQFVIEQAFIADFIRHIKYKINEILDASDLVEKITVLANVIVVGEQKDPEFTKEALKLLDKEINKIHTIIDNKSIKEEENVEIYKKLRDLKVKTKVTDSTKETLEGLWNKVDDQLIAELDKSMAELEVSDNKILEASGHSISFENDKGISLGVLIPLVEGSISILGAEVSSEEGCV